MTWITGAAASGTTPAGPALTVPVGVGPTWTGLIIYARGDGTDWDPVPAKVGASFTLIDDRAATNLRVTIWSVTGVTAGDVITSSATVNGLANAWHVYQDEHTYDVGSLAAGVRPGTAFTTTSGTASVTSGNTVVAIGLERSTATGTVVTSTVSTGGETVTQRLFSEETSTVTSAVVSSLIAGATSTRSVTITHTHSSTNGYAALISTTPVAGPPIPVVDRVTQKTEIEFVPGSGVYRDVSSRVEASVITHPRVRPGFGGATVELQLQLQNDPVQAAEIGVLGGATTAHVGFSPFVPENPAGAYYPHVDVDRRIRVTAYWPGGGSAVRFQGWIDTWTPTAGEMPPATAMVDITASCVLSRYARRTVLSVFGEFATTNGAGREYLALDDGTDATSLRIVSSRPLPDRAAQLVQPKNKLPGSATLSGPDGGHLTDGQIDFTRGDDAAPAPVITYKLARNLGQLTSIQGWFRLTNDPAGSVVGDDCITAWDAAGDLLWVWGPKLVSGKVQWQLSDANGVARSFYNTQAPREDGWHFWLIWFPSATTSAIRTHNKGENITEGTSFGSSVWPYDPRVATHLSIGGRMAPSKLGKQTNTFQGTVSSLLLQYGTAFSFVDQGNPAVLQRADAMSTRLGITTQALDILVGAIPSTANDGTPMMYTNATRDLLSRWNEHSRTTGGAIYTQPDGVRRFRTGIEMFQLNPVVTLDAEADLSAPDGGWAPVKDERPTRVTVNTPSGSYDVIDTVREAQTNLQLDGASLDTAAGTESHARSLASLQMNASSSRLSAFGIDLTTSANDLTAAIMALMPHDRMRITNLPASYLGITYLDVFATGWTEIYVAEDASYRFQFDTDPAADYTPGRFDSATIGRFAIGAGLATVTGGTCVGTTGTGTVILTGVPIRSTGIYPLDLNWNGERITVSAAGGATSPQTLTVSARGVAPTVARAHVAGEPLEVWTPLRFGV